MSNDHRVYRSFEEFEREELMRLDGATVDEFTEASFGDDLAFSARQSRTSDWDE